MSDSPLMARIRVRCVEDGDCLVWQGRSNLGKYPVIKIGGKYQSLRRVVWKETRGRIPQGKEIAATCETKNCIAHIKPLTHSEVGKLANRTGANSNPARCAKIAAAKRRIEFTPEALQDIRNGPGSLREIAARHSISKALAGFIRRGERWKDYSSPFAGLFTGLVASNDAQRRRA